MCPAALLIPMFSALGPRFASELLRDPDPADLAGDGARPKSGHLQHLQGGRRKPAHKVASLRRWPGASDSETHGPEISSVMIPIRCGARSPPCSLVLVFFRNWASVYLALSTADTRSTAGAHGALDLRTYHPVPGAGYMCRGLARLRSPTCSWTYPQDRSAAIRTALLFSIDARIGAHPGYGFA
ncbi:hypothetical protein B0H14DRAFT_3491613 [Mycena olivaceomarginata]|nr:hypothetical protein B0H14DRAFT_3491613 [Mycena olivaceomarginata]